MFSCCSPPSRPQEADDSLTGAGEKDAVAGATQDERALSPSSPTGARQRPSESGSPGAGQPGGFPDQLTVGHRNSSASELGSKRGSIGIRSMGSMGSLMSEDGLVSYGSESLEEAKRIEAARVRQRNHTVGHSQAADAVEDFEREKAKREEAAEHRRRIPTMGHSQAAAALAEWQLQQQQQGSQSQGLQSQSSVPEEPGSPVAKEEPGAPADKKRQGRSQPCCAVS